MTIRDIATIAQVSPATVSIVLNNKGGVSKKTRERILKVAKDNNYSMTKSSRKKMRGVLLIKFLGTGLLVDENQSFVSSIIDSIGSELRSHNYRLTMHLEENCLDEALSALDLDTCSVVVIGTELSRDAFQALEKIPVPYVVVDNSVAGINCNSITVDNSSNVYIALAHLKEKGHEHIAHLRSSIVVENLAERAGAFGRWAKALEFELAERSEIFLTPTLVGAYQDMCTELKGGIKLPSCLYADNDTIAIGAMKALKEYGYRIPQDISIIGMDDIPFSSICTPPLTTVRVQKDLIGKIAVIQLMTLLQNPEYKNAKTLITGQLVERGSVSPPTY